MSNGETRYKLIKLDSVDSTNDYAKRLLTGIEIAGADQGSFGMATVGALDLPIVVAAERQTAGRGRLGRSFVSPEGTGIYMSIVLPIDTITIPLSLITPAAAVATCSAIKDVCNVSPSIKWVNDIYLNNKKICGILTETQTGATQTTSALSHAGAQKNPSAHPSQALIIGIGVNCFPGSFPHEVAEIAGCISDDPFSFDKEKLLTEITNNLLGLLAAPSEPDFLSEYRNLCFIIGKSVTVTSLSSDEKYNATAVDIDRDGALIVERINDFGEIETLRLVSAEVSLHLD